MDPLSRKMMMMGGWSACMNPPPTLQQNPWILPDSNGTISQWGHLSGWGYPPGVSQQPPLPPELPPPPPPPPPPLPQGTGDFNFRAPTTLGPYSASTFQTSGPEFANKSPTLKNRGSNLNNQTTVNTTNMNPPRGDAMTPSMTPSSSKWPESSHSFPTQEIRKQPQTTTDETLYMLISCQFSTSYKELMNLLDNNMGTYQNAVQVGKIIHKLGHTFGKSWNNKKMHKNSDFLSILFGTVVNWDNVKIKALLWVIVNLQKSINEPLSFIEEDVKELTDIIRHIDTLKMDWRIETMEFLTLRYHLLEKSTAGFLTKEIDGIINSLMKGRDVRIRPNPVAYFCMERIILEPSDDLGKSFLFNKFNSLLSHPIPSTTPSMLDAFSKHVATLEHLTTKKKMASEGVPVLNKMGKIFTISRLCSDHDQNKFLEILFQNLAKLNNYGIKAVLWQLACMIVQITKKEATKMQQSSAFVKGYCRLCENFDIAQIDWKSDIVELLTIRNRFAMPSKMVEHNLQRIDQLVEKIVKGKGAVINLCNSTILGMGSVHDFYPSLQERLNTYETFIEKQFQMLLQPGSSATKDKPSSGGLEDVEDFLAVATAEVSKRTEVPKRRALEEIWLSDSYNADDSTKITDQGIQTCKSSPAIANESKEKDAKTLSMSMTKSHDQLESQLPAPIFFSTLGFDERPPKENKFLRRFAKIRRGLNVLNKETMDNTGPEKIKDMVKWFTKNQNKWNKGMKGTDNAKFFAVLFQEIPELNNYGIKAIMWAFCGMVETISFPEVVEFHNEGYFKVKELLDKFDISKCNWKPDVIEFLAIRRRLLKGKKINDECLTRINNIVNEMTNTKAEIDLDAYIQSFKSSTVITYDHFYLNRRNKNEIQEYNSLIEKHISKLVVQEFPETVTIDEEDCIMMEENAKQIQAETSMPKRHVVGLEPDSGSPAIGLELKNKVSIMEIDKEMHVNSTAGDKNCPVSVSVTETAVKPAIENLTILPRLAKITRKNLETLLKNVPTPLEEDVAQNPSTTNATAPIMDENRMEESAKPILLQPEICMPKRHVVEPDSVSHTLHLKDNESFMKSLEGLHLNLTTEDQYCGETVVTETIKETVVKPSIERLKCQLLQRLCKITPNNLETLMKNVPTSYEEDLAQNTDLKDMNETKPSTANASASIMDEKEKNYVMDRSVQEKLAYLCLVGKAKLKSGTLEPPLEDDCKTPRQSSNFGTIPNMQMRKRKGDKETNLGKKRVKKTYESITYEDYLSQFTLANVEISTIEITLPMDFTNEDYVNHVSALSYISYRLQMVDSVYSVIILHCSELYRNNLETNTL